MANYRQYSENCSKCGAKVYQGHAVSSNAFNNGQKYATCLICGGLAEMGFVQWNRNSFSVNQITINGSFILPNGVIVLVDKDIESYLNGTLIID